MRMPPEDSAQQIGLDYCLKEDVTVIGGLIVEEGLRRGGPNHHEFWKSSTFFDIAPQPRQETHNFPRIVFSRRFRIK